LPGGFAVGELGFEGNRWRVGPDQVSLVRQAGDPRKKAFRARPKAVEVDLSCTALVVVDMQNDFCASWGWLASIGVEVRPLQALAERLAAWLPELRDLGLRVLWCNWGNRPDKANLPPGVLYVYDRTAQGRGLGAATSPGGHRVLQKGSPSADLVAPLQAEPGDIWVDKYRMSGFPGTPLDSILRNLAITTVLFAGVNLDQCVYATLASLFHVFA